MMICVRNFLTVAMLIVLPDISGFGQEEDEPFNSKSIEPWVGHWETRWNDVVIDPKGNIKPVGSGFFSRRGGKITAIRFTAKQVVGKWEFPDYGVKGDFQWKLTASNRFSGYRRANRSETKLDWWGLKPPLCDLKVETFLITWKPQPRAPSTPGYYEVKAKISNIGSRPTPDEFTVALFWTSASSIDLERLEEEPGWSRVPDSTYVRKEPLQPGNSFDLEWRHDAGFDGRPAIMIPDKANFISAEVDVNESIDEQNEFNNERILSRSGCSRCRAGEPATPEKKKTLWFETSDSVEDRPDYQELIERVGAKTPEEKTELVLCYIQMEAQRRARFRDRTVAKTTFYHDLSTQILHEYLDNPTVEMGRKAVNRLGDYQGFEIQQRLHIPASFRRRFPTLPEYLIPASEFFATSLTEGDNLKLVPSFDSPFLIGDLNSTRGSGEWGTGGKNYTNLMHWATGIKYANLPTDAMRELFIGYEKWHMEGWDEFGEDAINDLIAEEQGRRFGLRLLRAEIKSEDELIAAMDEDFWKARAWVGGLLQLRQCELNQRILQKQVPASVYWKDDTDKREYVVAPWNKNEIDEKYYSIYQTLLARKATVNEMMKSKMVEHLLQIYTLIYEAEGGLSPLTKKIVKGEFDSQFRRAWSKDEWDIDLSED
jgi:hypothetical protein